MQEVWAGGGGSEWPKGKPEQSQKQVSFRPEFALWFPCESEKKKGVGGGERKDVQNLIQNQPLLSPWPISLI